MPPKLGDATPEPKVVVNRNGVNDDPEDNADRRRQGRIDYQNAELVRLLRETELIGADVVPPRNQKACDRSAFRTLFFFTVLSWVIFWLAATLFRQLIVYTITSH